MKQVIILLASLLLTAACTNRDSPNAGEEQADSEAPQAEQTSTEQEPAGSEADEASDRPVSLGDLTTRLGWRRGGDLPSASLPPIPDNAAMEAGLYDTEAARVGVVLVRYPFDGFARPHVEDLRIRSEDEAVQAVFHENQVIELRGTNREAVRQLSRELSEVLGWQTF